MFLDSCTSPQVHTYNSHVQKENKESIPRIFTYKKYKARQEWKAAYETLHAEIKDPLYPDDSDYVASIKKLTISALGDYAENTNVEIALLDAEALQYYQDVLLQLQGDPELIAELNNIMMSFYSKTNRNGQALPYHRKAFQYWVNVEDRYQIIRGYDGFASIYNDMGELELAKLYRHKALTVANGYFKLGVSPTDSTEWLNYKKMLDKAASHAAEASDIIEVDKLWKLIKPIVKKYIAPEYISHLRMAKVYAISGNIERAKLLLREAKTIWKGEKIRHSELSQASKADFLCAEAQIELEAKNFTKSNGLWEDCIQQFRNIDSPLAQNPIHLKHLAKSYEGMEQIDFAIQAYKASIVGTEKLRGSYAIAERASFFNHEVIRGSYWGLIRTQAEQAQKTLFEEDFWSVIQAMERIRARQFGELINEDFESNTSLTHFQGLAKNLDDDTIVLSYILMERAIVLLAFTNQERFILNTPYDRSNFNKLIRNTQSLLSNPKSSINKINQDLLTISKTLIGTMTQKLNDKNKIIVLQDGIMNLIPFNLLSSSLEHYSPLLEQKSVWTMLSLRLLPKEISMLKNPERLSFFAIGDPSFDKQQLSRTGISNRDVQEITRGSEYLQYFDRLPGTKAEVQGIAALFDKNSQRTLYGQQATESAIKTSDLRPFRYVHFATHGILGNEIPGLIEPALVLANEPMEDGLLTSSEVSKIRLNADLAVLSACKTGSGKFSHGEGVLGISRAFLLAGSNSVLVSLWGVADQETAQLMLEIYRNLQSNVPVDEALRKSSLNIRKSNPHPFYWAPFILIGNTIH